MIHFFDIIHPPLYSGFRIDRADNVYVYDTVKKRKFIDLTAGAGMAIVGYNNRKILDVTHVQADKMAISPQKYRTEEAGVLAGKILALFPAGYDRVVPAVTGSEAVEIALQAAILYTGRKSVVSFAGAYHGHTLGTGALGDGYKNFGYLKRYFQTVEPPINKAQIQSVIAGIEQKLKTRRYAAFIAEGVVTNSGWQTVPPGFYKKLHSICRKYGTLLVFDEVLTGFGRTGKMFSFEHHDVKPDVVCLAKGLASGYMPIAAVVTNRRLVEKYDGFSTFAWSPLACAVASANIEIIVKDRLAGKSRRLGQQALATLHKYLDNHQKINSINGLGLGIVISFKIKDDVEKVYQNCLDQGVLLFKNSHIKCIMIIPPLIIGKTILDKATKIITEVILGI